MDAFIDLLRHGATTSTGAFCGTSDVPLTAHGWAQMVRATAVAPAWTTLHSSPASRCASFAQHLATQLEVPLHLNAALRERDFGAWEGLTAAELPPELLAQWWQDPVGFTPPAAETVAAFRARVAAAWHALVASTAAPSHQLLITHGGVIRVILAEVLQQPNVTLWQIEVPPATLTRLRLAAGGQPSLVFHRN